MRFALRRSVLIAIAAALGTAACSGPTSNRRAAEGTRATGSAAGGSVDVDPPPVTLQQQLQQYVQRAPQRDRVTVRPNEEGLRFRDTELDRRYRNEEIRRDRFEQRTDLRDRRLERRDRALNARARAEDRRRARHDAHRDAHRRMREDRRDRREDELRRDELRDN